MFNLMILGFVSFLTFLSLVTVIAEPLTRRNSPAGRFFRAIRIRLREQSRTSFCVISLILLLWGLVIRDSNFTGIWIFIGLLFLMLLILHTSDIIDLTRRRKKAKKLAVLPLSRLAGETGSVPLAKELPELAPIAPAEPESPEEPEQKG